MSKPHLASPPNQEFKHRSSDLKEVKREIHYIPLPKKKKKEKDLREDFFPYVLPLDRSEQIEAKNF